MTSSLFLCFYALVNRENEKKMRQILLFLICYIDLFSVNCWQETAKRAKKLFLICRVVSFTVWSVFLHQRMANNTKNHSAYLVYLHRHNNQWIYSMHCYKKTSVIGMTIKLLQYFTIFSKMKIALFWLSDINFSNRC